MAYKVLFTYSKPKQKVEEEEGKKNSELSNDKCFSFNICTNTQPFA